MLVLTRKADETIRIGDDIVVTIVRVKGNSVRVGVEAPKGVRVVRGELLDRTAPDSQDMETLNDVSEVRPESERLRERKKISSKPSHRKETSGGTNRLVEPKSSLSSYIIAARIPLNRSSDSVTTRVG